MKETYAWLTHHMFLHIAMSRWFYAGLILVVGFVAVMWITHGVAHRLRRLEARTSKPLFTILAEALESTRSWLIGLLFAALGARALGFPSNVMKWLGIVAAASIALQAGLWLNGGIRAWVENKLDVEDVQARNPVILAMLGWIPDMVHEIIDGLEDMRFDRSHFIGFGESSLDFQTVYFMTDPAFALYRDRQHAINLELMQRFDEAGIKLALPARKLHVADPVHTRIEDRRSADSE